MWGQEGAVLAPSCTGKPPGPLAPTLVTSSLTGQLFSRSLLPAQRLMGEVSSSATQSGEVRGTFGSCMGPAPLPTHN